MFFPVFLCSGNEHYSYEVPEGIFNIIGFEKHIPRVSYKYNAGYTARTNSFLQGKNKKKQPFGFTDSHHIKISFQPEKGTLMHDLYASVYHGVGIALNDFRNYSELGNPWSFYVFQGARIFRLSPTLSVFYEWNFGISTGWKYYDKENNLYNTSVSSKNNAYINANFFFVWSISRTLDLSAGLALSHFSNGNTKQPNSGVNVFSGTVNMTYNIGRIYKEHVKSIRIRELNFDKHMIYELVLFGSWKRRGILLYGNETTQLVNSKPFGVGGITFSPLYSINPRLRLGGALDIVYDASANVTYSDYNYGKFDYYIPKFSDRLSAGIAAKVDYVMPIFTISVGLGMEVLRNGEDYRRFYQSLTLKTSLTERLFLNLGYRIKDFSLPSFLMLGVGYRFGQY